MKTLDIGLSERQRLTSVSELNALMSNLFVLYITTKKLHWDIVGPQFKPLHELLDDQAEILEGYIDESAERVRMLGAYPVGTAKGFLELASLEEHPGKVLGATAALTMLSDDHEHLTRAVRAAIHRLQPHDAGTVDHLTDVLRSLEKSSWMLRSYLEGESVRSDGAVKLPPKAMPSLA